MRPPAAFRSTNLQPFAATETIPLSATGSPRAPVVTSDGQLLATLPAGAIPAVASAPVVTSPAGGSSVLLVGFLGLAAVGLVAISLLWRRGRVR